MPQIQIPTSTHAFDNDNHTDNYPDHWVLTQQKCWHNEPLLVCLLPVFTIHGGTEHNWLPLWRMNGAGPNDSKIPVILAHGMFTNRFHMDYNLDGELHSLARFLANRGRDVWIIEWEQALDYSGGSFFNYLVDHGYSWANWYYWYMVTDDELTYNQLDTYFQSSDICSLQTAIVTEDDIFTATFDDLVFEDIPAIIAAVLNITDQQQAQWIGQSVGGTVMFGLLPTRFFTDGIVNAGYIDPTGPANMPPRSILSHHAIGSPTALIDVPPYLQALHDNGTLESAYIHRGKLPRYFNYSSQSPPKLPVKICGVMDTAQLKHLSLMTETHLLSCFNPTTYEQQYYYRLYQGWNLFYAWPELTQFIIYARPVTTPISILYDGNGYDDLGTFANIHAIADVDPQNKYFKPFYQFSHANTSHQEMILGYIFEGGDPLWPTHLQYDFGGTYHFLWYDLRRFLPPAPFAAYFTDTNPATNPFLSWQNNKDAVEFQVWGRTGNDPFAALMTNINMAKSGTHFSPPTPGAWDIKIRALALGGSWKDSSGASSTGDTDDISKFISITKI